MKGILIILASLLVAKASFAELVVYADRNLQLFVEAANEFKAQTGEEVVFVGGNDYFALRDQHIAATAQGVVGDLFITKDIMFFSDLKANNLTQAFPVSLDISKVIPSLQDTDRNYVALTYRSRSVAFSPEALDRSELTTYEDLADPKWQGRLCLRKGFHSYNISLVSYLLDKHGKDKTTQILEGWLNNLAAPIFSNDNAILNAIANGTCDLGIVNHYYLAGAIAPNPGFPVEMAFLEQGTGGVHTNGMGVALLKTSTQQELAAQFVQILLQEKHQLAISGSHFDFPVLQGLNANTFVDTWGPFEMTTVPWSTIGNNITTAIEVMTEVGYN
ncbi:MAG: extracellular solute-binding protein [Bdellovibrionaceae bacterium]|nr:extracellular solute-binding protein [Pseudobdellovibrionaceae bacterium]